MPTTPRSPSTWIPAAVAVGLALAVTLLVRAPSPDLVVLAGGVTAILLVVGLASRRMHRDIAPARKRDLAEQGQRNRRAFEALVRDASDALLLIHPERGVTLASPAAGRLLGTDPRGWSPLRLVRALHPDDRRRALRAIADGLRATDDERVAVGARLAVSRSDDPQNDDPQSDGHDVEVIAVDLRHDRDVVGIVVTVREITERTSLERLLHHQALHDHLTGLGNRRMFQDRLSHAVRGTRRRGTRLAVLMCDLDDFRDVNDTLGHAIGDELLVALAKRIGETTRVSDTVTRLGGDEFAVLCEDVGTTRDAVNAARRLIDAVRAPFDIAGRTIRVGMSVGVVADRGLRSGEDLLRDADVALHNAKQRGKDRVALHRTTMTEEARTRLQLADDLKVAIEQQSLKVAFQPIVDLRTQRIVGVEALSRWIHPSRGVVSPAEFIPVAEHSGLIPALGRFVLDRTLAALHSWIRAKPGLELYATVNLSARELREPDAVSRVADALHRHDITPSRLVLELTESAMLEDERAALSVMHQLRDHGLRFAVDDFGTGYSSLSYLRRLPVDIVKIDRSFVEELGCDDTADDLVRAIIDLSRALHLDVVAEGIETIEQQRILEELGCGLAQGYLLGRPMDELAILQLLNINEGYLQGAQAQEAITAR